MAKAKYEYGCNKCGRYVKAEFEFNALTAQGEFNDEDLPKSLNKICTCKKGK